MGGAFAVPLPCWLASGQTARMDLNKPAPPPQSQPQSFKGSLATATLLSDRVVFRRPLVARFGGNRSGEVLLADVIAINVSEPTRLLNGHVHLQTATDPGGLRAWADAPVKQVAGNPRSIMFTWNQRETFKAFVAAVQAAWEAERRDS